MAHLKRVLPTVPHWKSLPSFHSFLYNSLQFVKPGLEYRVSKEEKESQGQHLNFLTFANVKVLILLDRKKLEASALKCIYML